MPNGNFAIGNTYETTTRPVAFAVGKDCLARLGFPQDAYVNFFGHSEVSLMEGATLDTMANKNFFGTNTEAMLKIEEDPILDRIYEASIIRLDNNPIFQDDRSHVYIRPIYQPTLMKLNFRLRCKDEVEANRLRDDTWARANMLRHEQIHEVTYSWQIPLVYLVILQEIHKCIEKVDRTGDSFGKYLKDHFDPRVDTVTNLAGNGSTLIVPEDQVRVLGWFDFAGIMDKPTFNKETGTWDLEWSYSLVYDKPTEAGMTYPLVIRQQMLGPDYRPTEGMYKLDRKDVNPNNVNRTLGSFFNVWVPPKGILDRRYPDFDTWYPENGMRGCMPLWVGLTTISEENRRDILSIDTLGHHQLSETTRAFIMSDRKYVCDPARSLFDISVYSDNNRALPSQVELTEDGMIRTTGDVNMTPVYHVTIYFRRDLTTLDPQDIQRMIGNACKVYALLAEMYPNAIELGLIPLPSKRCTWTEEQWWQIVDAVSPTQPGIIGRPSENSNNPSVKAHHRRLGMQTVGLYQIISRRD